MNKVLEYIGYYGSDSLYDLAKAPYYLKIKESGPYVLFKYDQFKSDFSKAIVRDARGLIYNRETHKIVCNPFSKFFNLGEPNAADINWNHIVVTEKVDGSLIKLWYDMGMWHWSTNSNICAAEAFTNAADGTSFQDLIDKALGDDKFYNSLNKEYTHMFELVSPFNRIVIPYNETKLIYITSRHNKNDDYYTFNMQGHFDTVKRFLYTSKSEVIDAASKLDWDHEGFVVFDGFNRVKCKSAAYVKAHFAHTNGAMTNERLIDVILNNEVDEFLAYAPEYKDKIDNLKSSMDLYKKYCNDYFVNIVLMLNNGYDYKEISAWIKNNVRPACHPVAYYMMRRMGTPKNFYSKFTAKDWVKVIDNLYFL